MQVLIQVHYVINDMKALRRGYFKVNAYKFKQNPNEATAEVARQWIRELSKEYIYKIEIYKVLYNEVDITELVI